MVVFLDTYAIIEIDKGNPNYRKYVLTPAAAITTLLNLIEVHYVYMKNFGNEEADKIYEIAKRLVIPVDDSIIKEATRFKLLNIKKRLSFADCIGYTTARKYSAKFISGDYMFKGLEDVEFIR